MTVLTTAMCTSFKAELAQAKHNFTTGTGGIYAIVLIKVGATRTFDQTQTNVGNPPGPTGTPSATLIGTDEVTGTGYTTGGFLWTAAQNTTPTTSGTTAFWSWSVNPSWTTATFSAIGGIIYLSPYTSNGQTVGTFDFGGTQTVTAGTFTVVLPSNAVGTAILRIA